MTYENDMLNEDWIKAIRWDLPTDWPVFLNTIAGGAESTLQAQTIVRDFMEMPAWKAAPPSIVAGAKQYLAQEAS